MTRFTQGFITKSGLFYLRACYYDPALGRFISPDPFLGRLAEPSTQNRYVYVKNNPLGYTDPSGMDLTVSLYPGAGVFGHVGIGVNSPNTTGFSPAPGASEFAVMTGQPVLGVMQPDTRIPISTITIPATPQQDRAIQNFINQRERNPGNYDLNDRNCATTVHDALRAGGINTPQTISPAVLMNNLQQQFAPRP